MSLFVSYNKISSFDQNILFLNTKYIELLTNTRLRKDFDYLCYIQYDRLNITVRDKCKNIFTIPKWSFTGIYQRDPLLPVPKSYTEFFNEFRSIKTNILRFIDYVEEMVINNHYYQ